MRTDYLNWEMIKGNAGFRGFGGKLAHQIMSRAERNFLADQLIGEISGQ